MYNITAKTIINLKILDALKKFEIRINLLLL